MMRYIKMPVLLFVLLSFCVTSALAAEDQRICCPVPATHSVEKLNRAVCCNGPINKETGSFDNDCCNAKGTVHTKSDGSKYCCKNKNPQKS